MRNRGGPRRGTAVARACRGAGRQPGTPRRHPPSFRAERDAMSTVRCPSPRRVAGIPIDFVLFALTLRGRRAVPPPHDARRPDRPRDDHACTRFALHRLQDGRRAGRPRLAPRARVGDSSRTCSACCWASRCWREHFEESRVPAVLPALPAGRLEGRIRAAGDGLRPVELPRQHRRRDDRRHDGATWSSSGKVHIGYLAAIVAASNAGGAGSVVGDTTTTMMWIDGRRPLQVLDAYVAAGARAAGLRHPRGDAAAGAISRSQGRPAGRPGRLGARRHRRRRS